MSFAAFEPSPIKDGLQQLGEGCDVRLVEASSSDATRLSKNGVVVRHFVVKAVLKDGNTDGTILSNRVQ